MFCFVVDCGVFVSGCLLGLLLIGLVLFCYLLLACDLVWFAAV